MRSRSTAAALVAAIAAGSTALLAGPAVAAGDSTAPRVRSASLSDDVTIIEAKGKDPITVSARVTDAAGVTEVWAPIYFKGELLEDVSGQEVVFPMNRVSGTARDGVWEMTFWPKAGELARTLTVGVVAYDAKGNYSPLTRAGKFTAVYDTRIKGFDVDPNELAEGDELEISGRLQHVRADGWDAYDDQKVKLQFRKAGSRTWKTVGSVRTDDEGRFRTTEFDAEAEGRWRAVYAGNGNNVAAKSDSKSVDFG